MSDMGKKERTSIYIDRKIKRKAMELGLNISKIAENALKTAITAVSNALRNQKPGFEPGSEATQARPGEKLAYRPVEPAAGVQIPSPALNSGEEAMLRIVTEKGESVEATIMKFRQFLEVDLQREKLTVDGHAQQIARFLRWLGRKPVTREVLRYYLQDVKAKRPGAYKNTLSAFKVFFRDYMQRPDLVVTFHFPGKKLELKRIPEKAKLQAFYHALAALDPRMPCFFLLYATSGWRRREVMALHREDVDLEARILTHRVPSSETKGRLAGFFNEEAQTVLRRYMMSRSDTRPKLLPITERTFRKLWHQAAEECGFMLQPQLLRDWFCEEMGNLGVSDRYIDAFCGRVPKSVLAKHYTDYAPKKLKKIYDKAGLKVLA